MSLLAPAPPTAAAPPAGRAVEVSGLVVDRGPNRVLDGVDLSVDAGSTLALLGPSGCGKTTLLRTLAGLEPAVDGSIRVGDRTIVAPGQAVPAEQRRVGMVFQDWALFPHLNVARNVAFGLRRKDARREIVAQALALVDLPGVGSRMPATLSGGQQQRVAIARALATRPDVLLLDEPFSNLDAGLREQVRGEVATLLRDLGITTILVTHDQEEAFLLGDRVAVMLDGTIPQLATPATLYQQPGSPTIARFLGHDNVVDATVDRGTARTAIGSVPVDAGIPDGAALVLLRPEHVRMTADAAGRDRVTEVQYYGHDAQCRATAPDGTVIEARTLAHPGFRAGDTVRTEYVGPPAPAWRHPAAS